MSSKREQDSPEEKPAKRPRLIDGAYLKQDSDGATVVSFDNLNNDCLVHILSFLKTDEMNNATLINSAFREARNADSLDQTRTATIVIKTKGMNVLNFLDTIANKGWTHFFAEGSNCKCLKIIEVQKLVSWNISDRNIQDRLEQNPGGLLFQSVTSLDLSQRAGEGGRYVTRISILLFIRMLPKLQQVDLSCIHAPRTVIQNTATDCPNLRSIKYNGATGVYFGPSYITSQHIGNLLEIHLDGSALLGYLYPDNDPRAIFYSDLSETETYLFMHCHRLERVSMKNATWRLNYVSEAVPVPQEILIKLVRYHPTLRWLRSDLTDENIAMLKQERPEVTLVNE